MKRKILDSVAGLGLAFSVTAGSLVGAVELSSDYGGDLSIMPAFAATEAVSTILTVSNTSRFAPSVVKLRLRDREGVERESITLYLAEYDGWAAALIRGADGVFLQLADDSCAFVGSEQDLRPLPAVSALPMTHGYVEAYEMAVAVETDLASAIRARDCAGLLARWQNGAWSDDPLAGLAPPTGAMRVNGSIINVGLGTLYSIPSTSLRGFSREARHGYPADAEPNLASAPDGSGDPVPARICHLNECWTARYAVPLDAVAALLMAHELSAEYTVAPSLGARSEMVLLDPISPYRDALPSGYGEVTVHFIARDHISDASFACIGPGGAPLSDFCDWGGFRHTIDLPMPLNVLRFDATDASGEPSSPSPLIGLQQSRLLITSLADYSAPPASGLVRAGMDTFRDFAKLPVISIDEQLLFGRPMIGILLQEVTNAVLPADDGVFQRANYGGSAGATRIYATQVP